MIELPTDLPPELVPLSWLIGVWRGGGAIVTGRDEADNPIEREFSQTVSFSHDGLGYLNYSATFALLDGVGDAAEHVPLSAESGFWRLARTRDAGDAGPGVLPPTQPATVQTADDVENLRADSGGFEIEAIIAHPTGVSELYFGQVRGPRIDLATDFVARFPSSREHAASTRMYGLVEGDLLWAWDIAALGNELSTHASARLKKMD